MLGREVEAGVRHLGNERAKNRLRLGWDGKRLRREGEVLRREGKMLGREVDAGVRHLGNEKRVQIKKGRGGEGKKLRREVNNK